ncbi:MAG: hypothetical protein LVS60_15940 [Nodosilinea sp. LVE1205-7]
MKAAFPDALLRRIHGDNHACHITSTIVGQENTPSPGLAPRCRVINVPLNTTSDNEEFISPSTWPGPLSWPWIWGPTSSTAPPAAPPKRVRGKSFCCRP